MNWVCLEDRAPLAETGAGNLRCASCGSEHAVVDGIPLFARGESERAATRSSSPALVELWGALQRASADEVGAALCADRRCSRSSRSADWRFFLGLSQGGTVLELGAGFGDDSRDLAGPSGRTIPIVPNLDNARVVRRRLDESAGTAAAVAVLPDVSRLPLPDGSLQAIALEDAAAAGFGLTDARLPAAAAEWKRVLAPGGTVFVGLGNPLRRLPVLDGLWGRLRSRPRHESLNRQVKRWAGPGRRGGLGVERTIRTMTRLGFPRPLMYAPLPDENDASAVVPLEDARVVRYFLDHLVRQNSSWVRLGRRGAHGLVDVGLFRRLVPYYYLIFRGGARP